MEALAGEIFRGITGQQGECGFLVLARGKHNPAGQRANPGRGKYGEDTVSGGSRGLDSPPSSVFTWDTETCNERNPQRGESSGLSFSVQSQRLKALVSGNPVRPRSSWIKRVA